MAASCSSSDGSQGSDDPNRPKEPTTTATADVEAGAADRTGNPFVQDLWIYDRLRTVDGRAEVVDHTEAIVEHLQEAASEAEAVELIAGMTFTPARDVKVVVHDPEGDIRPDVDATAGVIDIEGGAAFAVLGTVEPDGTDQIGAEDRVFIDMSFLGDAIAPGDLAAADFMLVQLLPTGDEGETDLAPLELFAHRAEAEEILWSADDQGQPVVYGNELGHIIEGSMGPEIPTKAQPMLSGFKDGIKKCLSRPNVACIPDYISNFGKGATNSLGQIDKQLPIEPNPKVIPPPKDRPVPYIPPTRPRDREPLACQNGGCGRAVGDPHLTTFDGHRYGMQAVGELVLARHDADGLEVQVRTAGRPSGQVSWVDGVAVGIGDQRVEVGRDGVLVDGEPVSGDDLTLGVSGDGFELTRTYDTTSIATDAGHLVTMEQRSPDLIDVIVSPAADSTGWDGLLGDRDGRSTNDLVGSDGTEFSPDLDFDELYQGLVASWRVSDETSLFTYGDDESTADFTDLDYPSAPWTVEDLDPEDARRAEAACRLAGVDDPDVLEDCILDFGTTGDIAFLLSARLAATIVGILDGRLAPDGGPRPSEGGAADDDQAWYRSGWVLDLRETDELELHCPPSPSTLGLRYLYGDNPYHASSAVCRAAVHASVITAEEGGTVVVTRAPDQAAYPAATNDGLASEAHDTGGPGFTVSAP